MSACQTRRLWMIVMICFLLAGCSAEDNALRRYMHQIKSRPARPIEPLPKFEPLPQFTYPEKEERRSPFKPILPEKQDDSLAPNLNRPKQPLEAFPLDALKFVGVLKEGNTIWGLISQPSGIISRVKPGDYMGKNYGQIIRISEDAIRIEETVKMDGKWEKKMMTLKLHTSKSVK